MAKRDWRSLVVLMPCLWLALFSPASAQPDRPRLVVILVVDGLSQSQLLENRDGYLDGGFGRFLQEGARLTDAHYTHAGTFTASGHATILTGAHPEVHGVVGNYWLDPRTGEPVTSVADPRFPNLDEPAGRNASPDSLRVETLGDRLRRSIAGPSRAVAISGKDRAAVISAGREGTAYFFSETSGRFVSSTYFMEGYPEWWSRFHDGKPQDRWFGSRWETLPDAAHDGRSAVDGRGQHASVAGLGKRFPHPIDGGEEQPGSGYYQALIRTPFGNDYTLEFARAAIEGEGLGKKADPALLVLSLSSQDYVNHLFGPESRQARDHLLRLDRSLSRFLDFLENWLDRSQMALVLTSDHGFPATPEHCREQGVEADRIDSEALLRDLNAFLSKRFGPGRYAIAWLNPTIYLDEGLARTRGIETAGLEATAAGFLASYPGIQTVFMRTRLEREQAPWDSLQRRAALSWDHERSGHLFLVQKPCWYLLGSPRALASTHGSPHPYDTHVPVIFLGRWFRAGDYPFRVRIVDVAPTLARALGLESPRGSSGRVLEEILSPPGR